MKIQYDISLPLFEGIGVYPGDLPLTYLQTGVSPGDDYAALSTSLHLGTHVDAPSHGEEGGQSIGEVDLDVFMGPCQVMEVLAPPKTQIQPSQLQEVRANRLLIRTGSFSNPYQWQDFAGLSEDLILYLNQKGVILIGVDTPSIDLLHEFGVHKKAISCGMAILEGLNLNSVPEGFYELIALPLPLMEADGSPVRAVLCSKE